MHSQANLICQQWLYPSICFLFPRNLSQEAAGEYPSSQSVEMWKTPRKTDSAPRLQLRRAKKTEVLVVHVIYCFRYSRNQGDLKGAGIWVEKPLLDYLNIKMWLYADPGMGQLPILRQKRIEISFCPTVVTLIQILIPSIFILDLIFKLHASILLLTFVLGSEFSPDLFSLFLSDIILY